MQYLSASAVVIHYEEALYQFCRMIIGCAFRHEPLDCLVSARENPASALFTKVEALFDSSVGARPLTFAPTLAAV